MDRPCHSVLIYLITQFFCFCGIRQESALHDHDGSFCFFQKIIAFICLDLPMVLRIQVFCQLFLEQFRQLLPTAASIIVKYLCSMDILLRIAVLVNTDCKDRIRLLYLLDPALHILYLFIRGMRIIQSFFRVSGQYHLHTFRLQVSRKFFYNIQVNILLQASVDSDFSGIIPSVPRIDHYHRHSLIQGLLFLLKYADRIHCLHIHRRLPAQCRHGNQQQTYHNGVQHFPLFHPGLHNFMSQ